MKQDCIFYDTPPAINYDWVYIFNKVIFGFKFLVLPKFCAWFKDFHFKNFVPGILYVRVCEYSWVITSDFLESGTFTTDK